MAQTATSASDRFSVALIPVHVRRDDARPGHVIPIASRPGLPRSVRQGGGQILLGRSGRSERKPRFPPGWITKNR